MLWKSTMLHTVVDQVSQTILRDVVHMVVVMVWFRLKIILMSMDMLLLLPIKLIWSNADTTNKAKYPAQTDLMMLSILRKLKVKHSMARRLLWFAFSFSKSSSVLWSVFGQEFRFKSNKMSPLEWRRTSIRFSTRFINSYQRKSKLECKS
jgi:hypothetical protein